MQLKCSRELPQCARCVKFNIACTYPAPPDRKMLAALRAPPEKRRSGHNPSTSQRALHNRHFQQSRANISRRYSTPPGDAEQDLVDGVITAPDAELSTEVQDLLQEIYFTCQFHASMLFHRPTFLRAFETGQVPRYVLHALYSNSIMSVCPKTTGQKVSAN